MQQIEGYCVIWGYMREGLVALTGQRNEAVRLVAETQLDHRRFAAGNFQGLERMLGGSSGLKKEARCPFCNSIIYSRRHKLCGVCAQDLPDNCLFTSIQARNVANTIEEERQRHRAWLKSHVWAS